jgi:hypothetical protein
MALLVTLLSSSLTALLTGCHNRDPVMRMDLDHEQAGKDFAGDTAAGTSPVQRSACSVAEARGFEPRMGGKPKPH